MLFPLKKLVGPSPGLLFGLRKSLARSLPRASVFEPQGPYFGDDFRCFFRPPNRPPKTSRILKKAPKSLFFTVIWFLGLPAGCLGGPFWRAFLSHFLKPWDVPGGPLWGSIFPSFSTSKSASRRPLPDPPPTNFLAKIQPRTVWPLTVFGIGRPRGPGLGGPKTLLRKADFPYLFRPSKTTPKSIPEGIFGLIFSPLGTPSPLIFRPQD